MILKIALAASNGNFLVAEGGGGREVLANRDGIGSWDFFGLFNRSRPDQQPQHGDSVVLQAWNGRFVSAAGGGGGVVNAEPSWIGASSTFTIERVAGAGVVGSGEQVALRASNGNFVVAEEGGGGALNANRARRGPWEIFTIQFFRPQLVRFRSASERFVTAEGGGGSTVTANRNEVGLWETFTLINLSRSERTIRSGDTIALQTWNGKFVQAGGTRTRPQDVSATSNRISLGEQFTVQSIRGSSEIDHNETIRLFSQRSSRFIRTETNILVANGRSEESSTQFTIELAQQSGISFDWVPDGSSLPGRPFETTPTAVSGTKNLLVLYYHNRQAPAITASPAQMSDAIFGRAPSLSSWLQTMSNGVFRVNDSGVFGSIPTPDGPSDEDPDPGMSAILTAAEDFGVPLASFTRDGVFDTSRVQLVEVSAWGLGGQAHRWREGVSRGGVRFAGSVPWVGVTRDVNEGSRMVLGHEISHQLMNVVDKYGFRRPVRGDVIANRTAAFSWERFVVDCVSGDGSVRSGDRVMLRAHDGKYLAVDPNAPNVVNTEDASVGNRREFTISLTSGTGAITSGANVRFQSSVNRFMTAELGGNSVVTANRATARSWESLEINKQTGSGALSSGDVVTLRSSQGFFVVAETGARDTRFGPGDRERGYKWDGYAGGGQGGAFDNADANYTATMLSLFDRLRLGWVRPRYLAPDNRGCYLLRPFIESREALILFDPQNPQEWYTVENRQYRENIDEVPSSGIVISWIRFKEDVGYWQWWLNASNDIYPVGAADNFYPAVISAAAPTVAPNIFARPPVISPEIQTKHNDPNAAFTTQELVLPLGNGHPSRFHLSFRQMPDSSVAMCIR